jgi:cytochrome P450
LVESYWVKSCRNTVYHAWKGDRFLELYNAHEKYGPIVRVAPNMLSFNSATALKSIYGHSSIARCIQKGQFYTAFPAVKGVHNTHNSISKTEHGFKRRVLSFAFSDAALKDMEGMILNAVDTMLEGVRKEGAKGVDMADRFSWLTFDIMGELCFGKTFGMLTEQSQRFVSDLIGKASHNHYIVRSHFADLARETHNADYSKSAETISPSDTWVSVASSSPPLPATAGAS